MDSEDGVIFSEDDFVSRSFDVFEEMRRQEQLVDFKMTVENRSIFGHRLILAARIPHFREIFSTPHEEIILDEVDADILESVINFAYSGKIKITPGNALPLIKASKVLQLHRVYDACWEYLEKSLHSNNVLEFRRLAQDHGCAALLEAADNYIRQNFEEFSSSESFVDLSFQQLKEIISRDDIKVTTEEKVFEAVIRWVKSSESERRDLLPELLSAVRMYFLTPEYLIGRVSAEEVVTSSLLCRDLVDEAKSYHLLPHERSKFCRLQSRPRFCEKKAVSPPLIDEAKSNHLLPPERYKFCRFQPLFGKKKAVSPPLSCQPVHKNMHHLPTDVVPRKSLFYSVYKTTFSCGINLKLFDPEDGKWIHVSSYKKAVCPDQVVSLGEVIYIFEGCLVHTFNVSSSKWSSSEYGQNVSGSGGVAYNGRIYFFGGSAEHSPNVRVFDPGQKKFRKENVMPRPLSYPGVAVLSSSGRTALTWETSIYITGGCSGPRVYNYVKKYNLETRNWLDVRSMLQERLGHGCCDLNDKIYVCGGVGNAQRLLSSAEVFNPLTNQWNTIAPMTAERRLLSVSSHDDKVYVYGQSHLLHAGNIEIYDTKNNEWKSSASVCEGVRVTRIFLVKSVVPVHIHTTKDI